MFALEMFNVQHTHSALDTLRSSPHPTPASDMGLGDTVV